MPSFSGVGTWCSVTSVAGRCRSSVVGVWENLLEIKQRRPAVLPHPFHSGHSQISTERGLCWAGGFEVDRQTGHLCFWSFLEDKKSSWWQRCRGLGHMGLWRQGRELHYALWESEELLGGSGGPGSTSPLHTGFSLLSGPMSPFSCLSDGHPAVTCFLSIPVCVRFFFFFFWG